MEIEENINFCNKFWAEITLPQNKIYRISIEYKGSCLQAVFEKKRIGPFVFLKTIPFAPYNVIIIHSDSQFSNFNKFERETYLLSKLISSLSKFTCSKIVLHENILHLTDASYKNLNVKFGCGAKLTFKENQNDLWKKLDSKLRNHIKKAISSGLVVKELPINSINPLLKTNPHYKSNFLKDLKVINSKVTDHFIKIRAIFQNDKMLCYSIIVILPNQWHLIINENKNTINNRGANSLLLWDNIINCFESRSDFYFDGSNKMNIMKIFKRFNAETYPYAYAYFVRSSLFKLFFTFFRLWK